METGLEVTKGQYLLITVDEEDTWSAGGGPRTSNADGLGNPLGHNFGNFNKAGGSFLYGSLVASLDGGKTFFLVGTKWFGTASNDGVLSFYYWDSNQGDNGGSVIANVQIDSDSLASCQSDKQSLQQSLDENQAQLAAEKTAKEEALAKLAACETSPIFNGTWTLYDPQTPPIPMVLREAGNNRVVGSYTSDGGQVQFTKEGFKLVGYWGEGTSQEDCRETKQVNQKNTRYWGKMVLEFNENLSTYTGKYSYCNANPTTTWYGQKID
jgi:hypothetical protein